MVKFSKKKGCEKKASLILIVLMLIYFILFKYCIPIEDWLQSYLESKNIFLALPTINILLPLGLSFYLFNSVSLVESVAKRKIIDPDVISVLLYINFIPTLIAGPVNRAVDLLPQIQTKRRSILDFKHAFYLITLALIKLFMLSSGLSEMLVNTVFSMPANQYGWDTIIGVYGWAWTIYFNFSGYTDLVTGIAMLLGYQIPKNFDHPYNSSSLQEFWRRWHISLSNFIRDYIYFPLGGSRGLFSKTQINIMIAMILSGIWHGAGINFLIWGVIHGIGLTVYNIWNRWRYIIVKCPLNETIARLLTFHYICFSWVFFRADSLTDAMVLLNSIVHSNILAITSTQLLVIILFNLLIVIYPWLVNVSSTGAEILIRMKWYALPFIIIPTLTVAFFFSPSGVPGFIYANF